MMKLVKLNFFVNFTRNIWRNLGCHATNYLLLEKSKIYIPEKLICNFNNKEKYVVHTRNLKQALNHKLILRHFYKVVKANQSPWLKPYIKLNIEIGKKTAKN